MSLLIAAISFVHAGVVSRVWSGGKLAMTLDGGFAEVEWISPVAFRFTQTWGSASAAALPAIKHDQIEPEFEDYAGTLTMRSRYMTVSIDREHAGVHVTAGGETIVNFAPDDSQQGAILRFDPSEKIFGLMSETSNLNLRGETIERTHGFFLTNAGYGVYIRSPHPCVFDLKNGIVRIQGTHSFEIVFYYGPTPKEIFEQHQTVTGRAEVTQQSLPLLSPDRLPMQAMPLPKNALDSFDVLRALVRTLNQWSLSAILYPALDLSSIENVRSEAGRRAADLAAMLPILYSSSTAASFDHATREMWKPYLITYLRESYDRGYPLIRPLAMQFSRDKDMDTQPDVFMLGDEVLLAPVVSAGSRRKIQLPRGSWTDLRTNIEYRGHQSIEIDAPFGRVPIFVRNGAVLPLARGNTLELHYFPSLGGEFFLWEPEKNDNSQFHAAPAGDFLRVEIESRVPRTYEWILHHTKAPREAADDVMKYRAVHRRPQLAPGSWWHDDAHNDLHITVRADTNADKIVNISF